MNKYGKLIERDTLQFQRLLPGPIDRIWQYLVDGEKRALWFAGGKADLKVGGKMELVFNNSQLSSPPDPVPEKYKEFQDGTLSSAEVLKIDPPQLLSIAWEGGVVTFELLEQDEAVLLTLTHEKLPTGMDPRIGTFAGWHTHLDILLDRLAEAAPAGFWKVHMRLEDEYKDLLSS